jgi:hydrogenase maturation protein HypF
MALAWLQHCGLPWSDELAPVRYVLNHIPDPQEQLNAIAHQLKTGINSPLTSSMGRLFDAVSALIGVRQLANYEAQAAIELEALIDPQEDGAYPFILDSQIGLSPVFSAILSDLHTGVLPPVIAARFHNTVAQIVLCVCQLLRSQHTLDTVCLSGGVWQNVTLLAKTAPLLSKAGFQVYLHHLVPPNDGGLALGQAAIAACASKLTANP